MSTEEKQISMVYKTILYGLLLIVFIVSIVSSVWADKPSGDKTKKLSARTFVTALNK